MSLTPAKSKIDFGSSRVDYLAVTETKEKSFGFCWNIRNFKRLLEKDNKKILSPIFECKNDSETIEWSVEVNTKLKGKKKGETEECDFLAVYLCCNNPNPNDAIEASFQFNLLDSKSKAWKRRSATNTFTPPSKSWGYATFAKTADLTDPKTHLLEDDTLKLHCQIIIDLPVENKVICRAVAEVNEKKADRNANFSCDYEDLLLSSMFTDVSLQTNTKTLKAHKAILACRSSVFKAMFLNAMLESINNVVKIHDFEEDVVNGMLQYIYSGEIYQETLESHAVEFLKISDKYDIKGLKEEAEEVLVASLSIENVADCLVISDMFNALKLKDKTVEFFNINKAEVTQTEGFANMMTSNKSLFMDLYLAK